jgi:hypothetical protein
MLVCSFSHHPSARVPYRWDCVKGSCLTEVVERTRAHGIVRLLTLFGAARIGRCGDRGGHRLATTVLDNARRTAQKGARDPCQAALESGGARGVGSAEAEVLNDFLNNTEASFGGLLPYTD